jgi:hypothetical protein
MDQTDATDLFPERRRSCGFRVMMPCVVDQVRDYRRPKKVAGQPGQWGYPGQHGPFPDGLNRTAPAVNVT